ncbi:hypothetical protein Glove_315g52 [Diversispora epigaea]|uniref:Uncharacterized protein n=1 Tax=Diversispora epigaea TaxID=1348612 RepID=A0A397HXZ1_9GLOM|nr:hypothetical protein Glove_315g52 [Diversispora epigaea]
MITSSGECINRLPALIKRETQDLSVRKAYDAIFWNLPEKYVWLFVSKKHIAFYDEFMENGLLVTNIFAVSSRYDVSGMPGLCISASEKRDYEWNVD